MGVGRAGQSPSITQVREMAVSRPVVVQTQEPRHREERKDKGEMTEVSLEHSFRTLSGQGRGDTGFLA